MNLVILPHHNTITSLQQLQKSFSGNTVSQAEGRLFLPSYPLVCVLAQDGDKDRIKMLRDLMKNAQGTLHFMLPEFQKAGNGSGSDIPKTLIMPVQVPFMNLVKEAGFTPVTEPHIILGSWHAAEAGAADNADFAGRAVTVYKAQDSRSFRLALMQATPLSGGTALSEAGTAAAFSWKFTDAFWVKLG